MKYITINELNNTIRKNLHKIPHNIDFVIGIPRSGMIVASIISEHLNVPLIDIDSFCAGANPTGGGRLYSQERTNYGNVLVIDDTCFAGTSMNQAKTKLSVFNKNFIYMAAYLEGDGDYTLDFWLEDVRPYRDKDFGIVLYEWNIFNHNPHVSEHCMFDLDGVFCVEPPDERNTDEYVSYIKNATPLFVSKVIIGGIVTYRLKKYESITKEWLEKNKIVCNSLKMFEANSWDERRRSGISPAQMKADVYKNNDSIYLFIESNDEQARKINELSRKPVLCVETNTLYGC